MGKLTIQEIAKVLVEKNGLEQRAANKFATEMFAVILHRLEQGEQVKVKGLGVFKIISVEARESVSVRTGERVVIEGHDKVTFTPDAVMKELVNKPFSQFETVVLNDGVEFEDIKDDITEEELAKVSEEPVVEPAPVVEVEQQLEVAPVLEFPESLEDPADEEEPVGHSWWKWPLAVVVVLALMAASAYAGYYYGTKKAVSQPVVLKKEVRKPKLPVVADSIEVVKDTIAEEKPVDVAEPPAEVKQQQEVQVEVPTADTPAEVDEYAAKDERVRLGGYRIVGTAKEVKVQAGQTFYSICRAHLGPDMECYVEVYNDLPRNPTIKVGQVLKIPKLELKKKRKR
ncbi:MAG: HU family DNA-binding protein [Prevotella sp.]|nr:HU family DNA-binding protein [Prevotella sp.]